MAKRNDFMEGFLRGLYQSGVGNPEVNMQRRQMMEAKAQRDQEMQMNMAAQGMIPVDQGNPEAPTPPPATPPSPLANAMKPSPAEGQLASAGVSDTGTPPLQPQPPTPGAPAQPAQPQNPGDAFHPDHPVSKKIGAFIGNMIFPGSQMGTPLTRQYNPDPGAKVFAMGPDGKIGSFTRAEIPSDYKIMPDQKSAGTSFAAQYRQESKPVSKTPFDNAKSLGTLMGKPDAFDTFIKTAQSEGRNYLTKDEISQGMRAISSGAMAERSKVWDERLKYQKVKDLVSLTGIQPKVISTLQTNNMRSDRALETLKEEGMTWQAFSSAITDWQAIMQGGVPHEIQYADSKFPNWKETTAKWSTYATGHPTENVPPELVTYMRDMIQGIKDVDNAYLQQNSEYVSKTIGSTIPGFSAPGGLGEKVKEQTSKLTGKSPNKSTPKTTEDQQAIDWANKNPLDPRAIQIKKMHGITR